MKALSDKLNYVTQLILGFLLIIILIAIPTGYEGALIYTESEKCKAEVISTDESSVINTGLVQSGEQLCELKILDGMFEGETVEGVNMLSGSLENDKMYSSGDEALVVVSYDDAGGITSVTMTDHYRVDKEVILAIMFIVLLILFAAAFFVYLNDTVHHSYVLIRHPSFQPVVYRRIFHLAFFRQYLYQLYSRRHQFFFRQRLVVLL